MTTTRRPPRRSSTETPPTGCDLLSVGQAAERLGTTERLIRRLIFERRIRFYRVGRYVRFDARDLDAFVAAGLVEPRDGSRR